MIMVRDMCSIMCTENSTREYTANAPDVAYVTRARPTSQEARRSAGHRPPWRRTRTKAHT